MRRVLAAFGVSDDVVGVDSVGRAWSNRVWSVRTTSGHYAVKELLNPWDDPHWREWICEAITFEHLAVAAGVQAPPLLIAPDSSALVDLDDRTFRVHEWIEDAAPCPSGAVSVEVAGAVARELATMHALQVVPRSTDVFPTPSTATCDGWPDLVAELRGAGSPYAAAAELVTTDIEAVGAWLAQRPSAEGQQVMSHGDVDQKNLLLGGGTTWLVDWDVAAPWLPGEEALRTALSLTDWREPAVARAFLRSYEGAGGERVPLEPESLGVDLIISIDWLDRCLRVATGLQTAGRQRIDEARAQVPDQLRRIHDQATIAAALPRWLSDQSK